MLRWAVLWLSGHPLPYDVLTSSSNVYLLSQEEIKEEEG